MAVTLPLPEALWAVKRPAAVIPPTVVNQLKASGDITRPNWSLPVAVNCCVPPLLMSSDGGVVAMAARVEITLTPTVLVTDPPYSSMIVTVKV